MTLTEVRHSFDARRDDMLGCLAELVEQESPSRDKPALDALARHLAKRLDTTGRSVEFIANSQGGDHLLARFPGPSDRKPALLLGLYDTVWPRGTIHRLPFRVEGDRVFGPGIFDMKAGLTIIAQVLGQLIPLSAVPRPIWVLITSDEEIGSPTSRRLIEEVARHCAYVLVIEPPLADGSLKTARKGVGRFRLEVEGKAAHSGVAPQDGRSAIVELAHQILRVQDLQDSKAGTTLNVGVIQGGTTPNVVPAQASAEIDVRVSSRPEADRIARALHSLMPVTPEVDLDVSG